MTSLAGTAAVKFDRRLTFGSHSYPYLIRSGPAAWHDLARRLALLDADRFVLITSEGLPQDAQRPIAACLNRVAPVTALLVPDGEQTKTIAAIGEMAAAAIGAGATRRSVVVAAGGGLAGNMAGLLAALLFRGVRLIHMPTTLLAIADSAPSLKQAVNSSRGKNHLGTFKAPEFVWTTTDFLGHLPDDEIRSALGEAVKNVIAIVPDQIPELASLLRATADYTPAELAWIIGMCVDAKQEVMRDDPYETGAALACEYGHTAGHLFELVHGLSHGLAVGVGGLVAARVAEKLGYLDPSVRQLHAALLSAVGAPVTVPPGVPDHDLLRILACDNKRGYLPPRDGYVDMVLLDGLGVLHHTNGRPITQVREALVLKAIRETELAA
jgi:3-dehydroquinate synthetase